MIRIYAHLLAVMAGAIVVALSGSFSLPADWHEALAAIGLHQAVDQPKSRTGIQAIQAENKPLLALPAQIDPISPITLPPASQVDSPIETVFVSKQGKHESAVTQPSGEPVAVENDKVKEKKEPTEQDEPVPTPLLAIPSSIVALQKAPSPTELENEALPAPLPAIMRRSKPARALNQTAPPAHDTEKQPPTSEVAEPIVPRPTVGTANRITVPSVGIDVAVRRGGYDPSTGVWEGDEYSALHADITVPVNDSNGTTLIYGHAKWGVFGSLPGVIEGAEAVIFTEEGQRFVYEFESVAEVSPADVGMLTAEGEPKLILQTCSGWFDQYRTLVTFRFKEVLEDKP